MKVTTYIAKFLKSKGIDVVFELQGGMITRIIDEIQMQGGITIVSVHHEQAAAMAADAYARVKNKPGVAMATSGPGATNLITGIGNCYFDSVPAIFITGQVNLNEQKGDKPIRQLGFQETDIVSIVRPITKAAYAIKRAEEVPVLLEEAYRLSIEGRPGPVLLDIPMNIQYEECADFMEIAESPLNLTESNEEKDFINKFLTAFKKSKKPLLLVGRGIRAANAIKETRQLINKLNIPTVMSLNGLDVLPYHNPNRIGFIGVYGNRWANYALGTCDLLLVLGSRLDLRQTGADAATFSQGKTIYHVDIEEGELNNRISSSLTYKSDILPFIKALLQIDFPTKQHKQWIDEINEEKKRRSDIMELHDVKGINPNKFLHILSEYSFKAKAFTTDVGNNQMWAAQSIELNSEQLFLTSGGMGAMGYSLPAAIGVYFALGKQPVVAIAGDGGFQINIQELQTVKRNELPIKMVILNNHCLGMIRQFQDSYFNSQYTSTVWGYSAPDFVAVAKAYGIEGEKIEKEDEIANALTRMWANPESPYLLEVSIDIHANVYPKILFGNPLTKMEPFE